ncbi:TetR/AcrR family transcriptional regulator [Celeribacter marinus]|uniref:Transcriptional regulator, TetR family n=1 Tax=Celeribacter marinus TaxID=1397108 RepID=A0A0P0A7E7_9RHOB|nr:TetR/AcrR family transcriptional regulator [Celeribacter marinus]ALI54289.1 transcriptional regulator, TetR family [Celeribacter marinus]SFK34350.1 transcriptional regulator, TetR family [Celeribacter marinus]
MARTAAYDRDAALDAAMALFWDKGYHATSLKDLEAGLHMKPGSIYAAFTSKENLYLLALARYFEASRASFRAAMARADTPLTGLANHFRTFANLDPSDKARQACMVTKTLIDTRTTDPEIVAKAREYLGAMHQEFKSCFAQAIAQGALSQSSDPDRLARRYQANISALRLELARGAPDEDVIALAEDMAHEIEAMTLA